MKRFNFSFRRRSNERGFGHVELFFAVAFIAIIAFVGIRILNAGHAATDCVVDNNLVNSCRPWQGASSAHYPGVGDSLKARTADYETRTGTTLDFVHAYARAGDTLTSDEIYYVNRANTYLLLNFKPTSGKWSTADGSNAAVNADIDAMAKSIKAVSPKKIMFSPWHEPNNDVSGGATGCPANYAYKGSLGTPAQYRAMWQNVRNRFNALGVTNVEWAIIYQSGSQWDCMQKELWPGNGLVDWVMWDHYYTDKETFNVGTSRFYNWLTANSDATHDFVSKPWGIGEWGSWKTSQDDTYKLYEDGGKALQANTFPKIKLWTLWDSGADNLSQILYSLHGVKDQKEQDVFIANWAKNPVFFIKTSSTTTSGSTGDVQKPTVSITSPTNNASVAGAATFAVTANDNVAVTRVVLSVDGNKVIRDATGQNDYGWGSRWNSTAVSNGSHVITATAYDKAGNSSVSQVTIVVANADKTAPTVSITSPANGATATGVITLSVSASDDTAVTRVVLSDGTKVIRDATGQNDYGWGSRWGSQNVANGPHTITATAYDAAGNTSVSTITLNVQN